MLLIKRQFKKLLKLNLILLNVKKILILSQYYPYPGKGGLVFPGGTERYAYGISMELNKCYDIKVLAFCNDKKIAKVKKLSGFKIKYIYKKSDKFNHFLRDFHAFNGLNRELKKSKYDLVHVVGCGYHFALGAALACKLNKVKSIYTAELASYNDKKNIAGRIFDSIIAHKILNNFDLIISPSKETKEILKKDLDESKIKVLPNFIIEPFFQKNKKIKNSLLFIGRFEPKQKGIYTLLDALKISAKKIPSLKLFICGDTNDIKVKNEIIKRIKEYGLTKNIILTGKLNDKQLRHYYSIAQAFIIPSNYEALSIVLIEAMSARLPIIHSDINSFLEMTENGKYGIPFKKGNAQDLADKICKLISDKKLIKKYSALSNKRYKKFLLKNTIKELKKEYYRILSR
jgi:glycosyltransferase involved in cell wall biosynthesis